ncbi:MAG: hypothetical protein ACOCRK_03550 [bacterium]
MGQAKRIIEEQEKKRLNKLDGYRKMLQKNNAYEMDCPYCCEALSREDIKKDYCLHCNHDLPWNNDD